MSSYIVDELVENLFASAGVERGTYNLKSRQNFSNFFDAYIEPYKLTSDQHKIRSGLREIMNLQIDQSIKLNTVPLDQLENVLILQPPKKIIEYQSKIDNKFKANVPRSSKSKQQKTIKDTDNKDEMKAEKQIKKETSTIKKNISKPAPYKFDENNNLIKVDDKKTPSNFYEIVNEFFEEFWTLEFEEEEVNWAFFAIITSTNCKDFKLNDFADKSYSLAVIKEKLKKQSYYSIDDFLYDFNHLFANIFKYYPSNHNAYRKAKELNNVFIEKWEKISRAFT